MAAIVALPSAGRPAVAAAAAEDIILADFETPDALDGATLPAPDLDSVQVADEFACRGNASMRLDLGAFTSKAGRVFPRVWLNAGSTLTRPVPSGPTYVI